MKPLSIECPNLTCIINQSWPGCCILGLNHLLRSFRDRIHELFWFMCRIHMEYKGSLIIEGISDHHFFVRLIHVCRQQFCSFLPEKAKCYTFTYCFLQLANYWIFILKYLMKCHLATEFINYFVGITPAEIDKG